MLFRLSFALAMFVISLNVSVAFDVEKANPIEKGFVLVAALALLARGKIDRSLVLPALTLLFATFVSALFTIFPGFEWDFYFRQMINFCSLLIFLVVIPKESDRLDLLRIMAYVPLLQVSIGIVYAALGLKPLFYVDATIGVPRLGGSNVPAFLAGVSVSGALAAMFYADQKNRHYIWLAALNFFICLLTAGRMATFVGVVAGSGIFLFGFKRFAKYKPLMIAGGAVIAVGFLAFFGQSLMDRAASGDEKGRDILRRFLWSFHEAFPDWGIGLGHQYTIVTHDIVVQTGVVAAHNEYLNYLLELGDYGALIFAAGWIWLFANSATSRLNHGRLVYGIIILCFLIYSLTDNTFVRSEISMILVVAAYGTRFSVPGTVRSDTPTPAKQETPRDRTGPAYGKPASA